MFFKINKKPELTDLDLIAEFKKTGNLDILGTLYTPLMDMVYAIAFKYLKEEEACKDAVMAIFEQMITDLAKHDVQNFRSWLHTVTRNYCLMQLRQNKEDLDEDISDKFMEKADDSHQVDEFMIDLQLNHLESCLSTLNEEQQICIRMFYIDEKSYKEIVAETGFDENKVKSYIQNGKRNLKICIEKKRND
jgi:RNA polymerase sigma factor (sigma-70 family)